MIRSRVYAVLSVASAGVFTIAYSVMAIGDANSRSDTDVQASPTVVNGASATSVSPGVGQTPIRVTPTPRVRSRAS